MPALRGAPVGLTRPQARRHVTTAYGAFTAVPGAGPPVSREDSSAPVVRRLCVNATGASVALSPGALYAPIAGTGADISGSINETVSLAVPAAGPATSREDSSAPVASRWSVYATGASLLQGAALAPGAVYGPIAGTGPDISDSINETVFLAVPAAGPPTSRDSSASVVTRTSVNATGASLAQGVTLAPKALDVPVAGAGADISASNDETRAIAPESQITPLLSNQRAVQNGATELEELRELRAEVEKLRGQNLELQSQAMQPCSHEETMNQLEQKHAELTKQNEELQRNREQHMKKAPGIRQIANGRCVMDLTALRAENQHPSAPRRSTLLVRDQSHSIRSVGSTIDLSAFSQS